MTVSYGDIPCDFPYVSTDCSSTFASVLGYRYAFWRIVYMLAGIIGVAASSAHLFSVVKRGTSLQKVVFPFLSLVAVTFLVRGADPNGYGGGVNMLVNQIAWATASAGLYSICYTIALVWGSLLSSYGASWQLPLGLKMVGTLLLTSTWSVLLVTAFKISGEPVQKYDVHKYIAMQFLLLVVLGGVGTSYFFYSGVVLNKRLLASSLSPSQSLASTPTPDTISRASTVDIEFGINLKKAMEPKIAERFCPSPVRKWRALPKITKMLVLFCTAFVLTTAFQAFIAIQTFTRGSYELAWQAYSLCMLRRERGEDSGKGGCPVHFDDEIFGISQLVVLFLSMWAFWKIPSSSSTSHEGEDGKEAGRMTPTTTILHDKSGLSTYSLDLQRAGEGRLSDSSSYAGDFIPSEMRISESSHDTRPICIYSRPTR